MTKKPKMVASNDLVTLVKSYKALTNTYQAIVRMARRTSTGQNQYDQNLNVWRRKEVWKAGPAFLEVESETRGYTGRLVTVSMTLRLDAEDGPVIFKEVVRYDGK